MTLAQRSKYWSEIRHFKQSQAKDEGRQSQMSAQCLFELFPGILAKTHQLDLAEEVNAALYARRHFSFPVPNILYYNPVSHRKRRSGGRGSRGTRGVDACGGRGSRGVYFFVMERCPGVCLKDVIHEMHDSQLAHIAHQLKAILKEMASVHPSTLGSVTGGPYNSNSYLPRRVVPDHPFTTYTEFLDHYRMLLEFVCPPDTIDKLISAFPANAPFRFTHGDLHAGNIIVDGTQITGIIDWSEGAFWPSHWEYCRMHHPAFQSPGWDKILQLVFPGPRRQEEIDAHVTITRNLYHLFW